MRLCPAIAMPRESYGAPNDTLVRVSRVRPRNAPRASTRRPPPPPAPQGNEWFTRARVMQLLSFGLIAPTASSRRSRRSRRVHPRPPTRRRRSKRLCGRLHVDSARSIESADLQRRRPGRRRTAPVHRRARRPAFPVKKSSRRRGHRGCGRRRAAEIDELPHRSFARSRPDGISFSELKEHVKAVGRAKHTSVRFSRAASSASSTAC